MTTRSNPPGLTSTEPLPYNYTRWNGAVWPDQHVDAYNRELARIAQRHDAGLDVTHLVDGLYHMARGFDTAGRKA